MKSFFRRVLITLKYRPNVIASFTFLVAFVVYSLNYFSVSTAINTFQGKHMGLCSFIVFLASLLGMLSLISAFPKRKKPLVFMLVVTGILIAAVIAGDAGYVVSLRKVVDPKGGVSAVENGEIARKAISIMVANAVVTAVTALLLALMPLYGKLLKKIKTHVDIEDNGELEKIEIED